MHSWISLGPSLPEVPSEHQRFISSEVLNLSRAGRGCSPGVLVNIVVTESDSYETAVIPSETRGIRTRYLLGTVNA